MCELVRSLHLFILAKFLLGISLTLVAAHICELSEQCAVRERTTKNKSRNANVQQAANAINKILIDLQITSVRHRVALYKIIQG